MRRPCLVIVYLAYFDADFSYPPTYSALNTSILW
jgi:hypothetical protein